MTETELYIGPELAARLRREHPQRRLNRGITTQPDGSIESPKKSRKDVDQIEDEEEKQDGYQDAQTESDDAGKESAEDGAGGVESPGSKPKRAVGPLVGKNNGPTASDQDSDDTKPTSKLSRTALKNAGLATRPIRNFARGIAAQLSGIPQRKKAKPRLSKAEQLRDQVRRDINLGGTNSSMARFARGLKIPG